MKGVGSSTWLMPGSLQRSSPTSFWAYHKTGHSSAPRSVPPLQNATGSRPGAVRVVLAAYQGSHQVQI
jgi:hypothetical protein